jgi:hypothetical protein
MSIPTPMREQVHERLIAALLVGCVIVLLGLASGLGLTTPAASSAAPATSSPATPMTTASTPAPRPTATRMPIQYVAVPPPAILPQPPQPVATVTLATTTPTATPTPSRPVQGGTSTPTPVPTSPSPGGGGCPAGLLGSVIGIVNDALGAPLLVSLLGSILSLLGIDPLTQIAHLTPAERTAQVRAAVLGPLRVEARRYGAPSAVASACDAGLTTLLTRRAGG